MSHISSYIYIFRRSNERACAETKRNETIDSRLSSATLILEKRKGKREKEKGKRCTFYSIHAHLVAYSINRYNMIR